NLSLPLSAPKAKRQKQDVGVVKRLFNASQVQESKVPSLSDDITPPSSPEHYEKLEKGTKHKLTLGKAQDTGDYDTVRHIKTEFTYTSRSFNCVFVFMSHSSSVNDALVESENREDDENEDPEDTEGRASRLWVDRFSPRHYTELLSDDFTNRCLLKWLKLWDTVVFGRERKSRPARSDRQAANQNAFKPNQGNQNQNRFKSKIEVTEELLEAELDQYKRPKFKVALLSGPPGLGKTTLAHVIAKHAGYNVVEINASDDRSAEVFQKRIDTATQMKSVLGANERPNCLIIDEIDGAPAAAINILLAVLNRKDGHGGEAGAEMAKKKKKRESILLRPIICICNDLYVPALRPLRQQAFLLAFPQTQPSRLTQRLAEISLRQGLKADTGTLMSLCEKTDNDIRSCINTLQFLHSRGVKQLDSKTIQSISVGQKDQNKGLFHLWQEIFQLPRTKRYGEFPETAQQSVTGLTQRERDDNSHLWFMVHCVMLRYISFPQGLYDNYLSMRVRDPNLQSACEALDWLAFSDKLSHVILHGQNFSLMKYLPFLSITFHFLFAHTNVPRISYPHSQHEASSRLLSCKNALSTMLADTPASIRARISQLSLTLDILTLLLDIICPKLRPVNPQLFSSREKEQMRELIDTMLAYNLSYRQDLHAHIRTRTHTWLDSTVHWTHADRNHQQRLENIVKQTTVESRVRLHSKPVCVSAGEKRADLSMGTAVGNSDVWFRFNEGMSNAVRRNVYIRDLL
uniref:Chromosome transmission fidelity protein 18 homolog n=1 Tax=Neolamprologus brichardi TaxID=32507 RepID=A0A3Q4GMI0_NEOBR